MISTLHKATAATGKAWRQARKAYILIRHWLKKHRKLAVVIAVALVMLRLWFKSWAFALMPVIVAVTIAYGIWALRYMKRAQDADAPTPNFLDLARAWWFQTNRLDQARREWNAACSGYGLSKETRSAKGAKAVRVPELIDATIAVEGDPVTARIAPGKLFVPVEKMIKAAPFLTESIGCEEVKISRSRVKGQADVEIYWKDPLGHSFPIRRLPLPTRASDVVIGRRLDGSAATLSWEAGPAMVVGATGSGKSGVIWNALGDIVARGVPVEVMCADPKGGMEMRAMKRNLEQQMGPLRVSFFAENPPATVTMINRALAELRRRQPLIEGRKITEPTAEFPLLIVIIDEWLTVLPMLLGGGRNNQQAPIIQLLNEGRSAGIWPIAASQVLHASTVGDTRNMFTQRVLLRVNSSTAVDTVIPNGLERGALAHQLDKMEDRGIGWTDDDHGNLDRFRAALITDADIERILDGKAPKGMTRDSRAGIKPVAKDTYVYRARSFGPLDRLEYIGISNAPRLRFEQHAAKDWAYCAEHAQWENWWLSHVDPAKMLIEGPYTRADAEARERAAITDEMPVWNQVHNWDNPIAQAVTKRLPTRRIPVQTSPDQDATEPTHIDLEAKSHRRALPPVGVLTILYVFVLAGAAFGIAT